MKKNELEELMENKIKIFLWMERINIKKMKANKQQIKLMIESQNNLIYLKVIINLKMIKINR